MQPDKTYTQAEKDAILASGYIRIHQSLWDWIPIGSYIRYSKLPSDDPASFRPGGYIKARTTTDSGQKILILETIRAQSIANPPGYISYSVMIDEIGGVWKKYSDDVFIEVHLIYNSLARKDEQIAALEARAQTDREAMRELNSRVDRYEAVLKKIISASQHRITK